MEISIVISCFNEEKNVALCYQEIISQDIDGTLEIIFVNDGSLDETEAECRKLVALDSRVKLVNLTRNFGHELAMTAGMDYAKGKCVIFMDGDLQHPPKVIPQLVKKWREGKEIVLTKRRNYELGFVRRVLNKAFYSLLNYLSDFKISGSTPDFRLIDRKHIDRLRMVKQKSRVFRNLIHFIGSSKAEIVEFDVEERRFGKSKYSFFSLCSLAIDSILQTSIKPLRLITFLGIFATLVSGAFGMWIVFEHFYLGRNGDEFATLAALISFSFSFQTVFISILGEYVGRIHLEVKNQPLYFADYISQDDTKL